MAIKKTIDEKLKVKPIFLNLEHEGPHPERAEDLDANSAYEGPCRLGTGEQLTNSYDCRVGREKFKVFQQHLEEDYPEDIEFVNPSYEHWTDSFTYHMSSMKELRKISTTPTSSCVRASCITIRLCCARVRQRFRLPSLDAVVQIIRQAAVRRAWRHMDILITAMLPAISV